MKRTLCEILVGLAVIVMMVSVNQRITRLQNDKDQITSLKRLVRQSMEDVGSKAEIADSRHQILAQVSTRLEQLQLQLDTACKEAQEASFLREEIVATRREATLLRAELTRDVQQAKDMIGSYQTEVRTQNTVTKNFLDRTARRVEEIATVVDPDPIELSDDLLAPTVQLNGEDTVGLSLIHISEPTRPY